jgi:hypothetical protein
LPGERFVTDDGVAVPCGFIWDPPVSASVLRRLFRMTGQTLLLLEANGGCVEIKPEQFVAASRSAVRLTAEALAHV